MPMYESTYLILRYLGVIINLASLYKLDLKRHRTYPLFSVLYSPQFSCGSYNYFCAFSRVKSRRKIIRKRASLNINSIYVGIFWEAEGDVQLNNFYLETIKRERRAGSK